MYKKLVTFSTWFLLLSVFPYVFGLPTILPSVVNLIWGLIAGPCIMLIVWDSGVAREKQIYNKGYEAGKDSKSEETK